jgi:HAD superfamily hydrolase (TIGR01457 family)
MKKNLEELRCLLIDMDGTFYLGEKLLPGALELIQTLRMQGKQFLFLTNNSSKHRSQYAEKITRMGLPISEDQVLTSGEAAAIYLRSQQPGKTIYIVGTHALEKEFVSHDFILDDRTPELCVLGFDTTLTYNKLWKLCNFIREGLPYIATHPDINCPTETGYMPDIGAMIAFVKASTGREPDIVIGKPNRIIIEVASRKLGLSIESLGMVGDRLYTDIALGQTSGITTILVMSGETRSEDLRISLFQPDYIFGNVGELAKRLQDMQFDL